MPIALLSSEWDGLTCAPIDFVRAGFWYATTREMSPGLLCMNTFWLDTRGDQVFIKSTYYSFTLNEEKKVNFYLISTAHRETLRLSERE